MNISKEKDLYNFLQNLNTCRDVRSVLKCFTDFALERLDLAAVWVILFNPKTNLPQLRAHSFSPEFEGKKRLSELNKLIEDYFKGFEADDILEFLSSVSKDDLMLAPLVFNGNLQGVAGFWGKNVEFPVEKEEFINLLIATLLPRLEIFALKEENERTLKERMDFLASISHEFKTPLNSILGFSQLLSLRNSDSKLEKYIQNITSSSKILLGLIFDVLDLSRSQVKKMELKFETFSPKPVILEILSTLETQIKEKNIEVNYTLSEGVINADLRRFRQLVLNLISNAVKFNKNGGKITIVAYKNERNEFIFEIKDTGDGISKKDYSKIFKFFSQVNSDGLKRQEGSGIGLYLCKTIVEAHNGRIDFKSRLNHGTTFWVAIPN